MIAGAFTPMRKYNDTLRVVFSQGDSSPKAQCLEYIHSCIKDIENDTGPDFLYKVT